MYALNLDENNRILSVTYDQYAPPSQARTESLPDGDISDYRYIAGKYIYDPLPVPEQPELQPTQEERIIALEEQLAATKILLGVD